MFILKGLIDIKSALIQVMSHQTGNKVLHEPI